MRESGHAARFVEIKMHTVFWQKALNEEIILKSKQGGEVSPESSTSGQRQT
jgi:hypothetical protein